MEATHRADLIVVGSGAAGLSAALAGAEAGAEVLLITAGPLVSGSSNAAQGGVAAAVGQDDSPDIHLQDTLRVGGGLNDVEAVRILTTEGAAEARRLLALGVPFDGGLDHPDVGLEAGHSRRRVLHAGGGAAGRVLSTALAELARSNKRIAIQEFSPAERLIVEQGRVSGVETAQGARYGAAVVLASGGYSSLWRRTTNGPGNTGSGITLAWQAGASLADLELVQFHPTALDSPGRPAYLLSEALRGEGAQVVNAEGAPVVDALLPRDQLSRAINAYRREHGPVFLSVRHLDAEFIRSRFAALSSDLAAWDLDLAGDLIPISPAAHYCMGGIRTTVDGRTDLPGLFAAGEAACTGAQGANRLASNSLLECLVFGPRAARAALAEPARPASWDLESLPATVDFPEAPPKPETGPDMDHLVGVERSEQSLRAALSQLTHPEAPDNRLALPALVARAALLRRESRGSHFRTDAPMADARWRGRIHWRKGQEPAFEPVGDQQDADEGG